MSTSFYQRVCRVSCCHQPPTTINHCLPTVTWKPERINSASWEFFLREEQPVQPRNHEINVGFGFRLFLLISPKNCWDVGLYVDPEKFLLNWFFLPISNNVQILPKEVESPRVSVPFPLIPPWSSNRTCSPKTHHNKQPIWKRTNKKNHGGFTWQLGGTWFTFFRGITTI